MILQIRESDPTLSLPKDAAKLFQSQGLTYPVIHLGTSDISLTLSAGLFKSSLYAVLALPPGTGLAEDKDDEEVDGKHNQV